MTVTKTKIGLWLGTAIAVGACSDAASREGAAAGASALESGTIVGVIDGVSNGLITGWACETTNPNPVAIHLYLDGPAGSGTIFAGFAADQPNEQAVADACQAPGNHRFAIPVGDALRAHPYRSIYLHGISTNGGANNLLGSSGTFHVPATPFVKHGNNGSASCNTYCAGKGWGTAGICMGVAASSISCGQTLGLLPGAEQECTCADAAGTFVKHGDNGTVDCNGFCAGAQWGRVGACAGARLAGNATFDLSGAPLSYAADCSIAPGPTVDGAELSCVCMPGDTAEDAAKSTVAAGGTNSLGDLSMHDLAVPENTTLFRAKGGQLYIHEVGWLNTSEADRQAIARLFPSPPIFETGGPQASGAMGEILPYWPAASVVCIDTSSWPLPAAMPADYAAGIKRSWGEHAGGIGIYYTPNDGTTYNTPFASPLFEPLRHALLTAGALCVDAPPYYYLQQPEAYRAWVADSIRWSRAAGVDVVFALYPGSSKDFWVDTQATTGDVLKRGAMPTTWAINGYYGVPTGQSVLHPLGSESSQQDSNFTALHLLVSNGAPPHP